MGSSASVTWGPTHFRIAPHVGHLTCTHSAKTADWRIRYARAGTISCWFHAEIKMLIEEIRTAFKREALPQPSD